MLNTFDTGQIDQSKRLSYWTGAICDTFLTVDCRRQGDGFFHGEMKGCQLGSLGLIDVVSPPMEYFRGPLQLREHEEHFQLVMQLSGTGIIRQHGKEAVLMPGDIALYSAAAPSSIVYPDGSRTIAVKIPRQSMLERICGEESELAISLGSSSSLGSMIGNMIKDSFAWGIAQSSPSESRLMSGMLDIIAFGFDGNTGGVSAPVRKSPIAQIKRYMKNNLGDPDLLLTDVAARHNISMRTLNRLFAAEGTGANRWLWQQRLEASFKALSEGRVRQVSETALLFGYNDLSHFSKTFKKTYGVTPNQLLRRVSH